MIKKVKWQFGDDMTGMYIVVGKRFTVAKGKWKGLVCYTEKYDDSITFYFLKWYFNWFKKGYSYKDALQSVEIISDKILI